MSRRSMSKLFELNARGRPSRAAAFREQLHSRVRRHVAGYRYVLLIPFG
jgi:hypothetical protein